MTSVTIPASVTSIGADAFSNNRLTSVTIPNSVTSIGSYAFYNNQLTSVTIPSSVTSIGSYAFYNNQLISVTIPNSVTSIGYSAFRNNQLTSVTIPNSVTSISESAFYNNQLISVTIPDSVTSIGNYAFYSNQLTSVTIPGSVTSISESAFSNNQLTSVTIPDSVTSIGDYAFGYNRLTSVTIPDSVSSIGLRAFSSNNLTEVTILRKNISIGSEAFANNQSISTNLIIYGVEGSNSEIYANNHNHTFVPIPETIYHITINPTENGIVYANKTEASTNDLIIITMSPNKWFVVDELKINGVVKTPVANTYAFNMPSENVVVDVTFKTIISTPVESITVRSQNDAIYINTDGGTLQMIAEVLPEDATVRDVDWSVIPVTGSATINQNGLLRAAGNGTVTVKAVAQDGSGIEGEMVITISNQTERQSVSYSAAASFVTADKINIVADGTDKSTLTLHLRDGDNSTITNAYNLGTGDIRIKSLRDADVIIAYDYHGSYLLNSEELSSAGGASLLSAKGSPLVPDEQGKITFEVKSGSVGETVIQFFKGDVLITSIELVFGPIIMHSAVIVHGRTMVPVLDIFEALGVDVSWDPATSTITATKNNNTTIIFQVGSTTATVNGSTIWLDTPPQIINNKIFVPIRFIGETLGATVEWNSAEQMAIITLEQTVIHIFINEDTTPPPPPSYYIYHSASPSQHIPSAQRVLTIYYPSESITQEYSFNGETWHSYVEPLIITENCYVYTRAVMPDNITVTGGIEIYNILSLHLEPTVSVAIDNHTRARPQAGLNDAEVVYETAVAPGITRYLAVFDLNKPVNKIGPVRSAREHTVHIAICCKIKIPKVASQKSIMLQLEIP